MELKSEEEIKIKKILKKNNFVSSTIQCCSTAVLTFAVIFLLGVIIEKDGSLALPIGLIFISLAGYSISEIIQILHDIRAKIWENRK